MFRTALGETIFKQKYANSAGNCGTWDDLVDTLVYRVCNDLMKPGDMTELAYYMRTFKFIPAGRYLYYAGRPARFYNNCFSLIAEDTREGWAKLAHNHMMALMCGGGVGTYYGQIRPNGALVSNTGGAASGPIPLMTAMNEIGRNVMQGGARRSALYASLPCHHDDIETFLHSKDWDEHTRQIKTTDFNYPAPMDMTNISVVYNKVEDLYSHIFSKNIKQAITTGEPGFQFDFDAPEEVGRNACTEFISPYDSDMCNLGSINMANISSHKEMYDVAYLASQFLYCGTLRATLPYEKCYDVRNKHRKIGLGIMGLHEWCLNNEERYEPTAPLKLMMENYYRGSHGASELATVLGRSDCERYRAIAPSGTISMLAGTTSGIEPIYAIAMKRRWYDHGEWKYQYVIDPVAKEYIKQGMDPDSIETAYDLSYDIERRLKMQAFLQEYVDMGISSTINLPNDLNCELEEVASLIRKYAPKLRGLTFYPDGARGGQPLNNVSWAAAVDKEGITLTEQIEILENNGCKGGVCGI